MTLALIALVVLAVIIFAFVLEPILRAKGDQVFLDAAALPDADPPRDDEIAVAGDERPDLPVPDDERVVARRITDRPAARGAPPAGSDVS